MAFNIMIVDDSKTIRSVIKKTLQIAGVPIGEMYEAANGAEGLEQDESTGLILFFTI